MNIQAKSSNDFLRSLTPLSISCRKLYHYEDAKIPLVPTDLEKLDNANAPVPVSGKYNQGTNKLYRGRCIIIVNKNLILKYAYSRFFYMYS